MKLWQISTDPIIYPRVRILYFAITWRAWDIYTAEKWEQQGRRNVVRWEFKLFDKFKLHIACVNFNNLLNVAICFVVVSPRFRFIWVFLTRMNFFVASSFSNSIVFYRYNNVCLRLVINSPNLIGNCLLSLPPFTVIHALKVAQPL